MPMDVVEKKKIKYYCGECGEDTLVAKGEACPHNQKHTIKKSLVIVRKETDDATNEADDGVVEEEYDEDDYEEDNDLEGSDSDEDEEDDDEEDEVREPEVVGKRALEFLTLAGACAEQIAKGADYEATMTAFNDSADIWNDQNVSKANISFDDLRLTLARQVNEIAKQAGEDEEDVPPAPPKKKGKKLPPDNEEDMSKSAKSDIYKGLSPAVIQKLKAADELIEKNEVREWEELVEKSWPDVPMDRPATAASLRVLHATDKKAYKAMETTLNSAQESLRDSEIFKSFGSTSFDTGEDPLVGEAKAKIEKGAYNTDKFAGMTDEQKLAIAKSDLMRENPGKYYTSTAGQK